MYDIYSTSKSINKSEVQLFLNWNIMKNSSLAILGFMMLSACAAAAEPVDSMTQNGVNVQVPIYVLQQSCDSAFECGDYVRVLRLCPQIRAEQDLPYLLGYEAIANAETGNMPSALESMVKLVDITGLGADSYNALTWLAGADLGATSDRLRRQEADDASNPVWPESLGVIYTYYNLYNEAVDCYLRALSIDPSNDGDAGALAMLYNQLRMYREALHYADLALQLAPEDYDHVETKALVMRNAGYPEQASAYLTSIINIDDSYASLYVWRGMLRNSAGDYRNAADDFNMALLKDSLGSEAKLRLAIAEYNMGNKGSAQRLFEAVKAESVTDWSGNAIAAAYLGDTKAVEAYRERALAMRNKANNYFALAALADIEGKPEVALDYLREALDCNVLNPDIIQYDPNLRNVKKLDAFASLAKE